MAPSLFCFPPLSILPVALLLVSISRSPQMTYPLQLGYSLPQYEVYAIPREAGLAAAQMSLAWLLPGKLIPTPGPPALIYFSSKVQLKDYLL